MCRYRLPQLGETDYDSSMKANINITTNNYYYTTEYISNIWKKSSKSTSSSKWRADGEKSVAKKKNT